MSRSIVTANDRTQEKIATYLFPSNLEQTRVYFREMESLDDPLIAPRAPCLLIDLGSCVYSAALRPTTAIATGLLSNHATSAEQGRLRCLSAAPASSVPASTAPAP